MDRKKLEHFKNRLYEEKENISRTIESIDEDMGLDSSLRDYTSELSSCDNHPGDLGTETFEIEKNRALKANEVTHMRMVDNALLKIEKGTYGRCQICKNDIGYERLEVIPFASLCIDCENTSKPNYKTYRQDRPVEEAVIGYPFGSNYEVSKDNTGYDGEDTWQELESYNSVNYMLWDDGEDEGMEGIVEEVDKISNEQYKRQLP